MITQRRGQKITRWTPAEDAVLARHYPRGGAKACARHLARRSLQAIGSHAAYLQISASQEHLANVRAAAGTDAKPARDLDGLPLRQRPALRKCLGPDCGRLFESEHCGHRLCTACAGSIPRSWLVDSPASLALSRKSIGGAP